MANEFVVFLIGGLAILALLLILFGGTPLKEIVRIGVVDREVSANISGAILIGPKDMDALKPYYMDINTSYTKGTTVHELEDKELFNGLLFGSNSIEYQLDEKGVDSLKIKFTVAKTNGYAPLIIKVNDNIVEERSYALGEYEVSVDKSLIQDEMMVQLQAVSSGWRIWAPNVYELDDINFVVKSYSYQPNEFKFSISDDEYEMFQKGRIDLLLDENVGLLIAELNDDVIYSGIVDDYERLEFNKSALRADENTLSLKADLNSLFLGEANLIIFYKTRLENRLEQEFNLTEGEYNTLEKGKIIFDVVDVIEDGGLSLKILADEEELFSEYSTAEERTYTYNFGKTDVQSGTNLLLIESIDNALFAIKDLEITY